MLKFTTFLSMVLLFSGFLPTINYSFAGEAEDDKSETIYDSSDSGSTTQEGKDLKEAIDRFNDQMEQ